MSNPPYLEPDELQEVILACQDAGLAQNDASLALLRGELSRRIQPALVNGSLNIADQLRYELQQLNQMGTPDGVVPALSIWLATAANSAAAKGLPQAQLLRKMRNRVLGKKETVEVRYIAPPDREEWIAQLPSAFGEHSDYALSVKRHAAEERPDLVLLMFSGRIDDETERAATTFLARQKVPPFLFLRGTQLVPPHFDEAKRIYTLEEQAARQARVVPVEGDFVEATQQPLRALLDEVDEPRSPWQERAKIYANVPELMAWTEEVLVTRNKAAQAAFEREDYQAALDEYRRLESSLLERPTQREADDRRRLARTRISAACCLVNLQETERAKAEISKIEQADVAALPKEGQAILAGLFALLDRPDDARALLDSSDLEGRPRALLAALEGQEPTEDADDSVLSAAAARAMQDDDLQRLASLAMRLVESAEPGTLSSLLGLRGLVHSLVVSVFGVAPRSIISLEERKTVVETIEAVFSATASPKLKPHQEFWEEANYIWTQLVVWHEPPPDLPASMEGRVSTLDAPWVPELKRIAELMRDGDSTAALKASEALAGEYPERVPVQLVRAQVLLDCDQYEAAIAPARFNFEALPIPRNCWLLAAALFFAGRLDEAWQVGQALEGCENPDGARLYALMAQALPASRLELKVRLAAWEHYTQLQPSDVAARLAPVAILQDFGEIQAAQERALAVVKAHQVPPQVVLQVAQLLMMTEDRRDDLIALMQGLTDQDSPEAEQARLFLSLRVDNTGGYEPDWSMLHAAQAVRAVPLDELVEMANTRMQFNHVLDRLYNRGQLGLVECLRMSDQSLVLVVERILKGDIDFCPAIVLGPSKLISDQVPEEWLIDRFTFHLMDGANLVGVAERRMTAGHRFMMFQDDFEDLKQEAFSSGVRARAEHVDQLRAIKDLIGSPHPTILDARTIADQTNAKLVGWNDAADLSPGQLAYTLQAWVADADAELMRRWAEPGDSSKPPDVVLEDLTTTPEETLAMLRALKAAERSVYITRGTFDFLNHRIEHALKLQAASRRATRAYKRAARWVSKGWMGLEERAAVTALPPRTQNQDNPLRLSLQRELSYKEALIGHTNRRWLGADFAPFAWATYVGVSDLLRQALTWTTESWTTFVERYLPLTDQLIALDTWASYVSKPEHPTLLELGFIESLSVPALRRLARRGLDEPAVLRTFDRVEWLATQQGHPGCKPARVRIARCYASALRDLWVERIDTRAAQHLTLFLLDRLEHLSSLLGASTLHLALDFAFTSVLAEPGMALEARGTGKYITPDTPAGRLFNAIAEWGRATNRKARSSSILRALRAALLFAESDEHELESRVLLSALEQAMPERSRLSAIPPILRDASILSANWKEKPLADFRFGPDDAWVSYEDLCHRAVRTLVEQLHLGLDERNLFVGVEIKLPDKTHKTFWAPAEALILRLVPDKADHLLPDFAQWAATADGRLTRFARKLMDDSSNEDARRAFAHHAVLSPWRTVRDDPTQFLRWGQNNLSAAYPATVDDLCSLLYDERWPDGETTASFWKSGRTNTATTKPEIWDLIRVWGEVPGSTNGQAALLLALHPGGDSAVETFEKARDVLAHPEDHPAGRIALYILVTRLLADRHRTLEIDGQDVDIPGWLRTRLPQLFESIHGPEEERAEMPHDGLVVERTRSQSTLAAAELDLLHLCRFVLTQMPDINGLRREQLPWLLYRLHGWLIAQMAFQSAAECNESLQALRTARAALPQSEYTWPNEAFDPRRFGDCARYRTLVTLFALLGMERLSGLAVDAFVEEGGEPFTGLPSSEFVTPALLDWLRHRAEEPLTDSEIEASHLDPVSQLDWRGPVALPAMALRILLQLDATQWTQLSEPTRLRWFHHLHEFESPLAGHDRVLLWTIVAQNAETVTAAERAQAREWLEAVKAWNAQQISAWLSLAQVDELETVRAEVAIFELENERNIAFLCGKLLDVAVHTRGAQPAEAINALLDVAQAAGADATPVLLGATRLLQRPEWVESVAQVLEPLLKAPPFCDDERLNALRTFLEE